jgi:hypothetical protein
MNIQDLLKLLNQEKLALNQTNLAILQYIYPQFNDYYERYGVLMHSKLDVGSAIPLPNYVGSMDATIEAVKKLFPQGEWSIFQGSHGMYEGTVWVQDEDNGTEEFSKLHQNATLALLIAAFMAKEYVEKQNAE